MPWVVCKFGVQMDSRRTLLRGVSLSVCARVYVCACVCVCGCMCVCVCARADLSDPKVASVEICLH